MMCLYLIVNIWYGLCIQIVRVLPNWTNYSLALLLNLFRYSNNAAFFLGVVGCLLSVPCCFFALAFIIRKINRDSQNSISKLLKTLMPVNNPRLPPKLKINYSINCILSFICTCFRCSWVNSPIKGIIIC